MKPVVLDTSAVVAYYRREPGGDRVRDWLAEATRGERHLYIHRLSLGEYYCLLRSELGEAQADLRLARVTAMPWDTAGTLSLALIRGAARLKGDFGVAYADAIAGAWARLNDAILATTDRKAFAAPAKAGALDVIFLR